MDQLSFKEVSTLIGRSLVADFSELDSSDNNRADGKPEGVVPHSGENKPPFLPKLAKGPKRYTLVLDLDETLVHYNEETN